MRISLFRQYSIVLCGIFSPLTFDMLSFKRLFATKQHITDTQLLEAIQRAKNGLIDAHLGGNIIKQRITNKG